MPDAATSPDILTRVVVGVVGFVVTGGLLGYLKFKLEQERAPFEHANLAAQTDSHRAEAEVKRATAAHLNGQAREVVVTSLRETVHELREDVKRLREERDEERVEKEKRESEVRLLNLQLEREAAWRKLHKAPEPPAEGHAPERGPEGE